MHVLYDAQCGFCRWSVVQLLAWDARGGNVLRPVAIQSDEGQALLASVPKADRLLSAHAVGDDGTVYSGGDAVAVIADLLPLGAPVAILARGLSPLTRAGYGLIARNRIAVGRLVPASARARADAALARRAG